MVHWRAYSSYGDSGESWIGQIPTHWAVERLKYNVTEPGAKLAEKPAGAMYLGLENIESGTGRLLLESTAEEVSSAVVAFRKGDVLFGKLRPYLAKVVHAGFDGVCTTELLDLRPASTVYGRYLFYLLLSQGFVSTVDGLTYGSKMPRASSEQVLGLAAALPPLPEQRAIAVFLDRETVRIDALIALKERQIELLQEKRAALISHAVTRGLDPNVPMKESGVEWLGEVPAHWSLARLKFIASVQGGVTKGRDLSGLRILNVPYLRVANVQNGYVDLSDVADIDIPASELSRYALKQGDVLMTEGGDFDKLGRGTVWEAQIEPCIHQNHVFAIRASSGYSPYWISKVTETDYARHFFILRSKQTTNLASISATNLLDLPVVLPPREEQDSILRYLDQATAGLDSALTAVQHSVTLLSEYRAALISAAVTGKIDVRHEVSDGV